MFWSNHMLRRDLFKYFYLTVRSILSFIFLFTFGVKDLYSCVNEGLFHISEVNRMIISLIR
jgi:hypothetical protein